MRCSVIIPVKNNSEILKKCLGRLKLQTGSELEIIIVDNASTEDMQWLKAAPHVILLNEPNYPNSPYSARNRGLEIASGEVIAFLDATCLPEPGWLQAGIRCLSMSQADLCGSRVQFYQSHKQKLGEIYDSLTNIKMKESIEQRGYAKTASLFVKKEVIDKIGFFPEGARSGGDVLWTSQAVAAGFKLVYCPESTVLKEARPWPNLQAKQRRVARGKAKKWLAENQTKEIILAILKIMLPPPPTNLFKAIRESGHKHWFLYLPALWMMNWRLNAVMGTEVIKEWLGHEPASID